MKKIIALFIAFCCTSCTSLLLKNKYDMNIDADFECQVKVHDSVYNLPAKVSVTRSKQNLELEVISDSLQRNYTVKPITNRYFILNSYNLLGYFIDLTNPRRFYYGNSVFLQKSDTTTLLKAKSFKNITQSSNTSKSFQPDKHPGELLLNVSLPMVNTFQIESYGLGTHKNSGFLGIGLGLDYFYKTNRYIGVHASVAIDYMVPFPAPITYDSEHEHFSASTISVTDNFNFNRFTFGYGIHYSIFNWNYHTEEYDTNDGFYLYTEDISFKNKAFGLQALVGYRLTNSLQIGLNYKPTFFTIEPKSSLDYQHVLTFDLSWKIKLRKGKISKTIND